MRETRSLMAATSRALVGFDDFRKVARMLDAFLTRPAVVRGLEIPRRS
jgi:GSH-dependent disulfide-bond oxidoreductase